MHGRAADIADAALRYLCFTVRYINCNGVIALRDAAGALPGGSAALWGYGLFETMRVCHGAINLWHYHSERLYAGMAVLGLDARAVPAAMLAEQVLATVARNGAERACRVRLQVFSAADGPYGRNDALPRWLISCAPLDDTGFLLNDAGLRAGVAAGIAKSMDEVANLKSCSALIYALASRRAAGLGWDDALVCNTAGRVMESTIANIFWVKDGAVFTPPLTEGCVAGVMRRFVLENVSGIHLKPLSANDLATADEVFLTNAIQGIRWIGAIDNRSYGCAIARQLHKQLFIK